MNAQQVKAMFRATDHTQQQIDDELASAGLRRAYNEPGWDYMTMSGEIVWVTAAPANPHDAGSPGHPCGYGAQEQDDYDATVAHLGREW